MIGQMCWLYVGQTSGEKRVLHLRTEAGQPWRPYNECPELQVADYREPGGSLGWATYQKLLREGWRLLASTAPEANGGRFTYGGRR